MKNINTIIILLSLFFAPLYGHAESKPTVAVLWFENRSPDRSLDYLTNYIPDIVVVELSGAEWCIPVEREEVRRALDEIMLADEGFTEEGRVRRVEPADYLFSGHFSIEGEDILIVFRLYDWKRGRIETKEFATTLARINTAAKAAAEYLKDKLSSRDPSASSKPPSSETSGTKVVICLDAENVLQSEYIAVNDQLYRYPFLAILREELLAEFSYHGIDCTFINLREWNDIREKRARVDPSAYIYILWLDMQDNPSHPFTVSLSYSGFGNVPQRFGTPLLKNFSSLHMGQIRSKVLEGILAACGKEYGHGDFSSPTEESLVYYRNYLRQRFARNASGSLNEILKALYLYPDFSFYWYILGVTHPDDEYEKGTAALGKYLSMSSFEKHPMLYQNAVISYIARVRKQNSLSERRIDFLVALLEERLLDAVELNRRDRDLAFYLSRFYIFTEKEESKHRALLERGLISKMEYINSSACIYLAEKLQFGKDEKLSTLSGMLGNFQFRWTSSINWDMDCLTLYRCHEKFIRNNFGQDGSKQREFFQIISDTIKTYPEAAMPVRLIRSAVEIFDEDTVEECLTKISAAFPDTFPAYYWSMKKLEYELFNRKQHNVQEKAEQIVKLAADKLKSISLLRSFLWSFCKGEPGDEILTAVFSEALNRVPIRSQGEILLIVPDRLKEKISGSGPVLIKSCEKIVPMAKKKESFPEILIGGDFSLKDLAELFGKAGFATGLLDAKTSAEEISAASLVIACLPDMYVRSARSNRPVLDTEMLKTIMGNLKEGTFMLIIPNSLGNWEGSPLYTLNNFLADYNCYLDLEKRYSGTAVFLTGIFKGVIESHLAYHKSLNIPSGTSHLWRRFNISGYPIYSTGATPLIKVDEEYTAAASFPLPSGGTFVLTSAMFPLSLDMPPFPRDFYKTMIYRNIWKIFMEKYSGTKMKLTPVPVVRKLYDFSRIVDFTRLRKVDIVYLNPLSPWIKSDFSPDKTKIYHGINLGEEILKETDDIAIQIYCHAWTGLLYKNVGEVRNALYHLQRAYDLTDVPREKPNIGMVLLDTSIAEIKEEGMYTRYAAILEEVLQVLGMHYSEEVLSEISLPFYELKGRCEETAGNYEGALFAYREKSRRILKRTHCGASVRLFAYTLFRIGEIYYLQGNYEEADKGFCKVITFLSKEYPPKDSDEFFSKMFFYGIELPKPLHTKVASLIYLADIARKKGMDFVYERELKETIKLARQTKDNDLISLVDRLEIIINDAKN